MFSIGVAVCDELVAPVARVEPITNNVNADSAKAQYNISVDGNNCGVTDGADWKHRFEGALFNRAGCMLVTH